MGRDGRAGGLLGARAHWRASPRELCGNQRSKLWQCLEVKWRACSPDVMPLLSHPPQNGSKMFPVNSVGLLICKSHSTIAQFWVKPPA